MLRADAGQLQDHLHLPPPVSSPAHQLRLQPENLVEKMPPNMNAYTPPAASLSGRFGLPRTNAGQSSGEPPCHRDVVPHCSPAWIGKDVLPLSVPPASYKEQSEGCKWLVPATGHHLTLTHVVRLSRPKMALDADEPWG